MSSSSGFFNQRSLAGWDIAYDSRRKHNVGVINPELLPADNMIYRYYFFVNPYSIDNEPLPSFGGIGGGLADISGLFFSTKLSLARDKVEFILDFVTSIPRFDILFEVNSSDIVSQGVLKMPSYYLTVGYIFHVRVDSNNNVTHLINRNGVAVPVGTGAGQVQMPVRPNPDDRGRDWFAYYDSFESGGAYSDYNVYDGKSKGPDFDYTYGNRLTSKSTDIDRAKVHGLAAGEKYLITYESITSHLYRQHVKINFLQNNFDMLGVNISANNIPPFVEGIEISHYLWKEWTTVTGSDTVNHSGWRISESWLHPLKVHQIRDQDAEYDPVANPVIGYSSGRAGGWALFNMTNDNLATYKDSSRIGYSRNYANYLQKNRSSVAVSPNVDTNEITPQTASVDNFEIEYVSNKRVLNYGTDINASGVTIEQGGALGVLFRVNQTEYSGHWESQLYGRNYPENTRIVNVFNDSQHGDNGNVIAVYMKKRPIALSMLEDPYFFFVKNGELYQRFIEDTEYERIIGGRLNNNQFYLEHRSSQSSAAGEEGQTHPGKSVMPVEKEFKTFINNTFESAPVVTDSDGNTVTSYPRVSATFTSNNVTSDVTGILTKVSEVDSSKTLYVFGINVDSSKKLSSLKIKVRTPSSAVFKVRGWSSAIDSSDFGKRIDWDDEKSEREIAGVTMKDNEYEIIDLLGWSSIAFLEIISDREITSVDDAEIRYINSQTDMVLKDINSIAALTDQFGTFMLFYTTKGGRLNFISTHNAGFTWNHIEHIVMRGDKIRDLSGIVNREDNTYLLFYFYKDALLCQHFDLDLFRIITRDADRKAKALDSIRLQWANLIYGRVLKPESERDTRTDTSGNVVYEDINDNVIFTQADLDSNMSRINSVEEIMSLPATDIPTTTVNLSDNNKFILVGTETSQSSLASKNPSSSDYDVYQNGNKVIRLMIREDLFGSNFVYRCLQSSDDGQNWFDVWNYQNVTGSDKIARINYLSLGENSEEGTNIYLLYNNGTGMLYIFYFYKDVLLCKRVFDDMFLKDANSIADELAAAPLYAVAGMLTNVEDESAHLAGGNIRFGTFQQKDNNVTKYYSTNNYAPQKICGYVSQRGYIRVFLFSSKGSIDGYFFDGNQWIPEHAIVNNANTVDNL